MHAVFTFSTFRQYFNPFQDPNRLFFTAWPMLAACFVLFYLKDWTRFSLWPLSVFLAARLAPQPIGNVLTSPRYSGPATIPTPAADVLALFI